MAAPANRIPAKARGWRASSRLSALSGQTAALGAFLGTDEARFRLLACFLALVFLIGGGSRPDIVTLVVLRPAAVAVCGFALLSLTRAHIAANRALLGLATAVLLLVAAQLLPLPPGLWQGLPGRGLLAEIDRTVGFDGSWRPLAMIPSGAWNAFFSLLVPLAVLLLGVQLPNASLRRLLPLVLVLGALSAVLGLLQILGPPRGPLYFYRITNDGAAVGLFSNRNHAATFLACLAPLLATFAFDGFGAQRDPRIRLWLSAAGAALLLPLILVTGSRAGLAAGVLGLASVVSLYATARLPLAARKRFRRVALYAVGAAAAFSLLLWLLSLTVALDRVFAPDQESDLRFRAWSTVWSAAMTYLPVGSGFGSFAEIFQRHEPAALIKPTYFNHAHNDWLELLMTGGIPGLVLAGTATLLGLAASWRAWTERGPAVDHGRLARAASIILVLLALASFADYPLRTPSIASLAVLCGLWLVQGSRRGHPPSDVFDKTATLRSSAAVAS